MTATDFMAQCKVAKQYWPERVEVVAAVPRTPSGKIQKFILKDRGGGVVAAERGEV